MTCAEERGPFECAILFNTCLGSAISNFATTNQFEEFKTDEKQM